MIDRPCVVEVRSPRMRILFLFALLGGCGGPQKADVQNAPHKPTFTGSHVRAFTDTFAVTSVTDTPANVWVGSTHGLLRWDLAGGARYVLIGVNDGLPAERVAAVASDSQGAVWAATS